MRPPSPFRALAATAGSLRVTAARMVVLALTSTTLLLHPGIGGVVTASADETADRAAASSKHSRPHLDVITANIGAVKRAPALKRFVAANDPDVVAVSEAWRAKSFLRGFRDYRTVQLKKGKRGNVAMLVRRGIDVQYERHLRMRRGFDGPRRSDLPPRIHKGVSFAKGGVTWRVLGVHFPWAKRHEQHAAWKESRRAVVRDLRKGNRRVNVAVGDFNAERREMHRMRKQVGKRGKYALGGKVNHVITNRAGQVRKTGAYRKKRPGHGWVEFRVVA